MLAIWSGYGRHLLGGARRAEHRETQEARHIKAAKDKDLVQRLEATVIHWTRQIKEVVTNQDNATTTAETGGPLDEIAVHHSAARVPATPAEALAEVLRIYGEHTSPSSSDSIHHRHIFVPLDNSFRIRTASLKDSKQNLHRGGKSMFHFPYSKAFLGRTANQNIFCKLLARNIHRPRSNLRHIRCLTYKHTPPQRSPLPIHSRHHCNSFLYRNIFLRCKIDLP
jgi:hypothetical protein